MNRIALVLGIAVLVSGGCAKDDPQWPPTQALKLTLRPTWNGAVFNKVNVYLTAADERVLIQQVKLYLSGITAIGEDEQPIGDAILVDLTNGPQVRVLSVAAGEYDSLRFGLGLPPELNHADVSDIDPGSPLGSAQGMYWSWATMYKFLLFDGRFDTDPSGTGTPPFQFSMHTGRDECYRERTVPLALSVSQFDTAYVTLDVDLARFFTDGDQVLDLSQGSQSHGSPEELPLAEHLSDLAIHAISPE